MAQATLALVHALRTTANNLQNGALHSWGHHGACNCGNLIQAVTKLTSAEILSYAHTGTGEWTELAQEFCPITNAPLTLIFKKLEDIGLTPTDIHHIEYLTDTQVLNRLEGGFRWLKRNNKADAIAYFNAFANLLEDRLAEQVTINFTQLLAPQPAQLVN
jgi:hypothetical protein